MSTDTDKYVLEPRYLDGVRIAARTVTYPGNREEPPDDVTWLDVGEDDSIIGERPRQYSIQLDAEVAAILVKLALPYLGDRALAGAAARVLEPLLTRFDIEDDPDPTAEPF